ncbi:MAG: thioredoxin reductase (NADPH) [Candidatus Midichloriaceae bacterium]
MLVKDVVIIGAGPVGLFTVFQAGMLKLSSCVVDVLPHIGGQCSALYPEKPIYDIPGFSKINAQDLIENLEKQASPFDAEYFLGRECINIKKESNNWIVTTTKEKIKAKTIIIAAGAGSFEVRKPPIKGISEFENKSVFYNVINKDKFKNKVVTIAGGGDSAIDWALILASGIAKKVYLIHRRDKFRASPKNIERLNQLKIDNHLEIISPFNLKSLKGNNGVLTEIIVENLDGEERSLKSDYLLPFFGMNMNIGTIQNWNLEVENKHISVDPSSMETNLNGVFAIGDICNYPGKLKLILTGFSEAAVACHAAYAIIHPDTPLHFEYSTTKGIHK